MLTNLVCVVLQLAFLAIILRIVLSWFPISPGSALASIYSVVYNITEPVLGPVRRVIPPLGMFDLSAVIVLLGVQLLSATVCRGGAGFL